MEGGGGVIEVKHGIIRASAGSGKTYQLARRFIRLLALGVAPERIAALTFTRKAAGEFFDRILRQLAELAADPASAGKYVAELRGASKSRIIALLRLVIARMDRLRLGTMDSFFAAMVRCLPFEFGLAGAGALLSDEDQCEAMEDALDALLREAMRPENRAARSALLEAWKRAFYGRESGSPVRDIEPWLRQMHPLYLANPSTQHWGDAATIWPDRAAPIWKADADLTKAKSKAELQAAIARITGEGRNFWDEFFAQLAAHVAGEPGFHESRLNYMLDPARRSAHSIAGGLESRVGRGKALMLEREAAAALREVLMILVGRELKVRCERTAGRRDLVELYETMYHHRVRGQGRLVFADLPLLLGGRLGVTRSPEWKQLRLALEYRLNCSYEHWLFDEFQDTNFAQWNVFENLIAEVLQDPSGQRSVFAVGDIKQSIYLWRDAEPELFRMVEAMLPRERTDFEPLSQSYRSCPAVLDLVNRVFSDAGRLEAHLPGLGDLWECPAHESAGHAAKLSGHAALIAIDPPPHDGDGRSTDEAVAALIKHADPMARNLTCAVIVRTNDEAARLSVRLRQLLRDRRMEVLCESEEAVATDNPITLALLSILRVAAHPQDTAAWEHLRMTPLETWRQREEMTPARLGAHVRVELAQHGFLGVATEWLGRMRECVGVLDPFSERRAAQFLELAAAFDQTGSRDLDAFIRRAREHRRREEGSVRAIQVMTVHKSKGLEFDIVILPQLGARPMEQARDMLLTSRNERGRAAWFLERPPKLVWEWDGRLGEVIAQTQARVAFEALCRLYVAMTRAKRALFVLLPPKPQVRSEAQLVRSMLAGDVVQSVRVIEEVPMNFLFESGDATWLDQITRRTAPAPVKPSIPISERPALQDLLRAVNQPIQRRTPSGAERLKLNGARLLSPRRESSRDLGTLVHRLFSEVEWLDGLDEAAIEAGWRSRGLVALEGFGEARELVRRTLADEVVRGWFLKGTANRIAWRERSFDMVTGTDWITGQVDRVVLEQDAEGRLVSATILDFKTDEVRDEAEAEERLQGYQPQLELYAKAVGRLTGLQAEKLRTGLVFITRAGVTWAQTP